MEDGVGGKGNAGVAGYSSIGYVNQSYIDDVVRPAALQNKLGDFVLPSVDAGAKALNGIKEPCRNKSKLEGAYPITLTWILAYETGNGKNTDAILSTDDQDQ